MTSSTVQKLSLEALASYVAATTGGARARSRSFVKRASRRQTAHYQNSQHAIITKSQPIAPPFAQDDEQTGLNSQIHSSTTQPANRFHSGMFHTPGFALHLEKQQ